MSFSSEEEVDCPCGETFSARLWNSVNLKEDPDLRSILLGGSLNVVTCPACSGLVYDERFVLVHDPLNELLMFVHPKARSEERGFLRTSMIKDAAEAQSVEGGLKIPYPPVLVFGLDDAVEMIRAEEESTVQAAVLSSLARGLPVNVVRLSPSQARAAGLPRSVPLAGGGTAEERLTAGLKTVQAANDRLTVFADLLKKVETEGLSVEARSVLASG
jgi:hypothetical protein